ncbi:MAG TPA: hypothetical protein VK985_04395 [Rariglobus sp.]|nr:hypothetical protein [Rariglobus sp.]
MMNTPFLRIRHFFAGMAALTLLCLCPMLTAQSISTAPKAVLFQTLALNAPVSNLFYELKGKPVPIQASTSDLSRLYETDADRKVSIFRLVPSPDPAAPPRRITVATLNLNESHPYLVLLTGSSKPESITANALEDSWQNHPEKTFRIINRSKRKIAVQLGAEEQIIESGQSPVFQSAGSGYDFDFKMASWEGDHWGLRVQAPQSIIPGTRATIVVSDPTPTPNEANPTGLSMTTVFDDKQLIK